METSLCGMVGTESDNIPTRDFPEVENAIHLVAESFVLNTEKKNFYVGVD